MDKNFSAKDRSWSIMLSGDGNPSTSCFEELDRNFEQFNVSQPVFVESSFETMPMTPLMGKITHAIASSRN